MSRYSINRRGFLKLAGATGVAGVAGMSGLPSPFKASASNDEKSEMFLHYDQGKLTPSFCEMCFWNCGVNVYTRKDRIHKLEGNPLNPNNYGHICAKGNSGVHSTYDPNRIQYPLIRVGKRGEGKFKKVSWEEANEYIYKKLNPIIKKHGAQSLATFMHGTGEPYVHALTKALGSPNIVVPAYSQCLGSREMAWILTFGSGVSGHEVYDMANTKHMIIFGRNMAGSLQVREAEDFVEGLSRGAKLTYIDPRMSESAARATNWLQINPGTDLALALAFIHVIIRDNLFDIDFVKNYCHGFEQLAGHVKDYTPAWASKKSGIDAKTIEKIAWDFAKDAPHVVAIPPRRMTRYGNDTQTVRAIAILNALMGNYGVPGGLWVRSKVPLELPEYEEPKQPTTKRADGAGDEYPLAPQNLGRTNGIIKATLEQKPYPVKAWLLYGTNPLFHSGVGSNDTYKAIENLELLIAIDTQFSDTVMYADVILPESTYLERDDAPYIQKDKIPFVALRKAAIKPIFDTKGCFDICKGIAKKFGVERYFKHSPSKKIEDLFAVLSDEQAKRLKEDGVLRFEEENDPYPLASGKGVRFHTKTGKVQLYVPELAKLQEKNGDDYSPLPIYKDPPSENEGFRLLFGKTPRHTHARTQNNWLLMELQDDNPIWIHPNDAKKLNLNEKDEVFMVSKKSGIKSPHPQKIKITKRIKEGSVFIHHGFGHTTKRWSIGYNKGIGDNFFVSNDIDPISGAAAFNNGFVKLIKA